MSNHQLANGRPFVARTIHRLAVPIILAWLAITVIVTIGVPSLEQVEKEHSVSQTPKDAPAFKAMGRMVADFKQANSENVAMVVLEGQQPLGDDAHRYYDGWFVSSKTIRSMSSTFKISGGIHSPPAPRKAPTVRLCTFSWTSRVTWARP